MGVSEGIMLQSTIIVHICCLSLSPRQNLRGLGDVSMMNSATAESFMVLKSYPGQIGLLIL